MALLSGRFLPGNGQSIYSFRGNASSPTITYGMLGPVVPVDYNNVAAISAEVTYLEGASQVGCAFYYFPTLDQILN